jgi:hypothetical protein
MNGQPDRRTQPGTGPFKEELLADSLAAKRVEIAIVSFGPVEVVNEFQTVEQFTPPQLTARKDTPMGQAILQGLELLNQRKALYREHGIPFFRPWVFLITDGSPTDDWNAAAAEVRERRGKPRLRFLRGRGRGRQSGYPATDFRASAAAIERAALPRTVPMAIQLDALGLALGAGNRSAAEQSGCARWLGLGMSEPAAGAMCAPAFPASLIRPTALGCQDACAVQLLAWLTALPCCCWRSPMARAALLSRVGAALACQTLLAECAPGWLAATRGGLDANGGRTADATGANRADPAGRDGMEQPIREFACTLLGAVLTRDRALFLQIGDGAIVIGMGHYRPVFWPQGGEYPNETWFVTDPNAAARLECAALAEPIVEIALLTDGLQPLALHYQSRQAHAPFFRPCFNACATTPKPAAERCLTDALAPFSGQPSINQRTHDDKTLILASRLAAPVMLTEIEPETGDGRRSSRRCQPAALLGKTR